MRIHTMTVVIYKEMSESVFYKTLYDILHKDYYIMSVLEIGDWSEGLSISLQGALCV